MSDMKYNFFAPDSKGLKQWFMHWESDIKPAIENMLVCLDGARGLPCKMSYKDTVPRLEDDELTGERCMVVDYDFHSWGEDCDDAVSIPLRLFNESLFAAANAKSIEIKRCPKCGAANITFNHPAYDGGSYVSCCSCNYAPQADTWANSAWEALKRWNDLPREEAPYNCEDTEETAKDEKTQEMNTKDLIDDLVKDKMGENQGMQGDLERIDEDEFYIRDYIHTFGARYANNTWALKFAAPVEIEVRDADRKHEKITVFGLGFHGRGRIYAIVNYKDASTGLLCGDMGVVYDEKEFGYFMEHEKSKLVDMMKNGNCGLFAFDRMLDKPEEEAVFHRCPDMIRKYIRDNGHLSKGISKYVVRFKEPVEIRTGMREKSLALGMDCDEEHDDKLWVLLDSKTDAYGCPMIGFMELVDSERFKCCDHLEQGDAGTFDWENPEPQELEVDDSESAKMRETGKVECCNSNYLHVEIPEVKVKHGTVLRDGNGNSWIFLSDNMPTPEFRPLYRCCQKVEMDDENNFNITTTKIEEGVTDEKEEDEYTAFDLGLITQNAIEEDLAKLKPVVKNIIAECIKRAEAQRSDCEVSVDLGGRNSLANKKAEKIEGILKSKGFDVKWRYGDGGCFKENAHVFTIKWKIPDRTQATLHA